MTGFYGKTYRYKDKVIGVCETLNPDSYMIGHATKGGHKRVKNLPIFGSIEEAQNALDDYARAKGLLEASV
ncbi:MAG: hypothetical protein IJQ08_01840 [Synergistaceae bacterium]|nr:hypothetical protein [Synergistaceae bacterium]